MKRQVALALLLTTLAACNTPTTPFPHAELKAGSVLTLHGTVERVIVDSQSFPTSVVLTAWDGTLTPISIPPELAIVVAGKLPNDLGVDATVVVTDLQPEVRYRLIFLRDARGAVHVPVGPNDPRYIHTEGVIKTVNPDNGTVLLSSGVTVHVEASQLAQHSLDPGSKLSADGPVVRMSSGLVLDAHQINGLTMRVNLPPGGWGGVVVPAEGDMGGMDTGDFTGAE